MKFAIEEYAMLLKSGKPNMTERMEQQNQENIARRNTNEQILGKIAS